MDQPTLLSVQEMQSVTYWEYVRASVNKAFDKTSSDQIFGVINETNIEKLGLYHQLKLYLDIMAEERLMEENSLGQDSGDDYYKELYCIKTIQKGLYCKGVNPNVMDVYFESRDFYMPPYVEPTVHTHDIIKTGWAYLPAGSELRVTYKNGGFPNEDYTLTIWSYSSVNNRVEVIPSVKATDHFVVVPVENTFIRYIAAKQMT